MLPQHQFESRENAKPVEPIQSREGGKIIYICPGCNYKHKRKVTEPRPLRCPRNIGHGRHCYQPFEYGKDT